MINIGFTVYSLIQYKQAEAMRNKEEYEPYIEYIHNTEDEGKITDIKDINEGKTIEFIIIGFMCLFSVGWLIIDLRLYKVFGWNVFKQLGADIGVKSKYRKIK